MGEKIMFALAAISEDTRAAGEAGLPVAHMSYKIGEGFVLKRRSIGTSHKSGFMCVSDDGQDSEAEPDVDELCRDILHECRARDYSGIILDFEGKIRPELGLLIQRLSADSPKKLALFIRDRYSAASKDAYVLVGSGVTGGSFRLMLQESIEKYNRVALEIVRLYHDFPLTDAGGAERELGVPELARILEKHEPVPYFSNELCTNYFTYKDRDGTMHFVLFDDSRSLSAKLTIADSMGVEYAFGVWSELSDLLPLNY